MTGRMTDAQNLAWQRFVFTFDSPGLADLGPHLSCWEAHALADLLRSFGHVARANVLLDAHAAADDDEGDTHQLGEDGHWQHRRAPELPL